jgi:hypothetical protein
MLIKVIYLAFAVANVNGCTLKILITDLQVDEP